MLTMLMIFMAYTSFEQNDFGVEKSLIQQPVELRPDLILLRAGDMAKSAFFFCLHLGGRCLRLGMIEIEVSPPPRVGKALRILGGHICAIERAREITSSRRLLSRFIRVFPGQYELQFLEQDCAFRKFICLLVYLV